ncbi:MAG: carboxy terminal-processing peptidase [Bdellovibrionales bacterium]|nr:carboxy terminal-processing peptidase [Bdellovibrionales bacterium]
MKKLQHGLNFARKTMMIALVTSGAVAQAQTLQCQSVPALMNVFLSNHFSVNQLNSDIKGRTVNLFMKYVDPNKQLLLKSDVAKMKTQLTDLFETMKNGNCASLNEISSTLVSRAEENLKIVSEMLGKADFKLDETVKYQSDSKKRDYPSNVDEKKAGLTSAIQTQLATTMAGDVKLDKAKQQLIKRYELAVKRSKELNTGKMINLFAESFAHSLDPHSDYMSPEQLDEFKISMNLSLEGIGVSLSSDDGYTIVQEIIPGGSADRAHALMPKDKIIAVAQDKKEPVNIIDMDLSDVVKMIRGKKGTKVELTVLRQKGSKSDTFKVTLVRDKVDMREQAAKITYQDKKIGDRKVKIGLIDLPSFYGGSEKNSRDCYTDLRKLVEEAASKKVDGIILDLSANGGGLLQDAVKIAGMFIKTGPVVATQDVKKNRDVLADEDAKIIYNGPLMLLTTRQSASASEILAGAMKDYRRALIVGGDHTYGKGSVQVLNPLPLGLGAMKLTTQMFYLPGGNSTQNLGVASDVSMPTYLDIDDMGEQFMDYALPPSKTEPFISMDAAQSKDGKDAWIAISDDLVKTLKEKSAKRVEANQEFKDIQKDLDEVKKNEGWVKVADIMKKSDKDKTKRKDRKEKASTASGRKELWLKTPQVQEAINIMVDWLSYPAPKVTATSTSAASARNDAKSN